MIVCPSCRAEAETEVAACPRCGCSFAGLFRTGDLIAGRYEIVSPIGRGGMGVVYHAVDRALEEAVAIKVLRSDFQDSPEIAARFRAEIKLARKVSHRNVCRIYEYGEHGNLHYISMELVSGTDLRTLLRESPLSTSDAFDVIIQSAQGLEAIHEVGVIHRDLKTSNIMRDHRGSVRLMDFGIAKQWMAAPGGITMTGQIIGTPEYMSPEQARGDKIDFRSDLYSLGIVAFEVFTGKVPFHAPTPLATIFMHMHEPPPVTGPGATTIPDALRPVLLQALAKEARGRFADAGEMVEALREARTAALGAPRGAERPRGSAPPPSLRSGDVSPVPQETTPVPVSTPAPTRPPPPATAGAEAPPTPVPPVTRVAHPTPATRIAPPPHRPTPPPLPRPPSPPVARPSEPSGRPALIAAGAVLLVAAVIGVVVWKGRTPPVEPTSSTEPVSQAASPTAPGPSRAEAAGGLQSDAHAGLSSPAALPSASPGTVREAGTTVTTLPAAVPRPSPSPRLALNPPSPPANVPAAGETGLFQVIVKPWAEVIVDGKSRGTTPFPKFELPTGAHTVRLVHPRYRPLLRVVKIRPGETTLLEVDLSWEAVPASPQ